MYGFIVLAAYAALMMVAVIGSSWKPRSIESFHVADRKLGLLQSAMSIAATWIWAPALWDSRPVLVSGAEYSVPAYLCPVREADAYTGPGRNHAFRLYEATVSI